MLFAISIAEKFQGLPLIAMEVIFDTDATEAKFAKPTKYQSTHSTEYSPPFITAFLSLSLFPFSPHLFWQKTSKLRFRKQILEIMFSKSLLEMSFTNGNFSFSVSPFLKISLHAPCFWQWKKVSDFQIFFGFLNNFLKFCPWMSHHPQADAQSDCCTV